MKRDQIVSIRLSEDERAFLASLGGPTDVLRELLLDRYTKAQKAADLMAWATGPTVIWQDGTTGQTWPAVMTS